MNTDGSPLHTVAGWAGHAGPSASLHDVHLFESALEGHARRARPVAWEGTALEAQTVRTSTGSTRGIGSAVESVRATLGRHQPDDSSLAVRRQLGEDISANIHLASCASRVNLQVDVALGIAEEIVDSLVLARLVTSPREVRSSSVCDTIAAFSLWARAAKQPKWSLLQKRIDLDVAAGRLQDLALLWHAWRDCADREHLSLELDRSGARLVDYLLASHLPRGAMIVVRHRESRGVGQRLAGLRLAEREVVARPGRPSLRLQVSDQDTSADTSSGATLSVMGLHWEMVLLGSYLLAQKVL